jgi:phosphoribosylformimino-5-aminoimidazole carboxamide ribotide isomerase
MLHLVDLDATLGSGSNFETLRSIAKSVKIPVQVAGGLRNEKIIESALEFAQRVVIGTLAFNDKTTLSELLTRYGKEKLVISADHNNGLIVVNGWQQSTKISLISAVTEFIEMGFSEYLSTSIVRDGTLQGPDLKSLQKINEISKINLIVSGVISNIEDVIKVKELDPFGVILGKALYENQISIEETKLV